MPYYAQLMQADKVGQQALAEYHAREYLQRADLSYGSLLEYHKQHGDGMDLETFLQEVYTRNGND